MKGYKLIGLTGATGAGKSTVAKIIGENGYEVIYADSLAREIMQNPLVLQSLKSNFGEDIVRENTLDRKLLSERAFKNKQSKALLDRITHPYVTVLFIRELERLSKIKADRILFDASQLFESGLDVICDFVIAVTADESVRAVRIKERDSLTDEQAQSRMSVQYDEKFFRENSDYIIENNSDERALSKSVRKIIDDLEVRFGSDKQAQK